MIEQLLAGGATKATLPWSGPGIKVIKFGTEDLGYFGTVDDNELFTPAEVLELTGLTAGTVLGTTASFWFKFIFKGKIIYIRNQPTRHKIKWSELYSAGLIYGESGTGVVPGTPGVGQLKWKIKEEGAQKWFLKARTIKGASGDPYLQSNGVGERDGSEFDELLGRVCTGSSPGAGKWEKYSVVEVGLSANQFDITANSFKTTLTSCLVRGYGSIDATQLGKTTGGAMYRWRPVLELFDGGTLVLPPETIIGAGTDGLVSPRTFTATIGDTTAVNPQVVSGALIEPITPPKSFTAALVEPVFMPINVLSSVDFKPVTLKFTTV